MVKPRVKLIGHTPEPDRLVSAAAKLCYSRVGAEDILEGLSQDKVDKFLNLLMEMGHQSPIEHASFTFAVEGVSRVLTHQLVRHRIASYSQQSQRYVRFEGFEYIIPPHIEEDPQARELFQRAMQEDQRHYDELVDILYKKHYERLKKEEDGKKARQAAEKMAIEDARYVFPNACETKIIFTMNARSLYNFFRLRCCSRAQWEVRDLAEEMLRQVRKVAPILFKNAGPACLTGPCPEGAMSCGQAQRVRERFECF
ncbi:MAG: FAD-dependent thymidylate synthase [Bacillota bacterium]|nr:FAD-dependent thymidylate synthase [Bacillota bacterium]MDD3297764.1 FAD-dependent thymidylate synthase [Bacillota bacterium]MDD3851934.1 FAD-dependent thymidylate synthase [Bacillota bacterium]MDD4706663.1 FAD-dependent thymidylate synthase [Bacillota bacterium]